jgi:urease accessory protein
MDTDAREARGARPYVFTDLLRNKGLTTVVDFIFRQGGLEPAPLSGTHAR